MFVITFAVADQNEVSCCPGISFMSFPLKSFPHWITIKWRKKKEHLQGTIKCKLCQFHLPECPTLEKTYFHGIQINNYRGGHDYFEWFFF